jgi:ArsR family transcriptional regulator
MDIEISSDTTAALFKALGDPTRLGIFQMLRCCPADGGGVEVDEQGQVRPTGSLSVGEVCCRIGGSTSTISHHLKELRLAGLIRMEKRGRWIYCSVNPEALGAIRAFVEGEGLEACHKAVASEAEIAAPRKCCPESELASTCR